MDLGTLLGLVVSIGVPALGGLVAAAKLFQRVKDHDDEIAEMKLAQDQLQKRLAESERATHSIDKTLGQLQTSIEGMAKLVTSQIENLGQRMSNHNTENNRRFDELSERLSERRSFRSDDK